MKPSFSIITVCLNSERFIERNLQSVKEQTYTHLEQIIIDGVSTDETLKIVDRHRERISVVLSEKDAGIYDAMNKGARLAKGDYLLFLNSDDRFYATDALELVAAALQRSPETDLLYAKVGFYNEQTHFMAFSGDKTTLAAIGRGYAICHQTCFFRRTMFQALGGYMNFYRIGADNEMIVRYFKHGHTQFLDQIVSVFSTDGRSSKFDWTYLSERERARTVRRHFGVIHLSLYWVLMSRRMLHKFLRHLLIRLNLLSYWHRYQIKLHPGRKIAFPG